MKTPFQMIINLIPKLLKDMFFFVLWILLVASFQRCVNPEQTVKSPFSRLDTVKSKVVQHEEEKSDKVVKSPFSGLDKK